MVPNTLPSRCLPLQATGRPLMLPHGIPGTPSPVTGPDSECLGLPGCSRQVRVEASGCGMYEPWEGEVSWRTAES